MKSLALTVCALLYAIASFAAEGPIDIGLLDGSKIKGRVVSTTASEVTVISDLGVFRIPLEKLTPESKVAITAGAKQDSDALLRRIAELEAKVSQLQQENESLRRQVAQTLAPTYRPSSGANSFTPSSPQPSSPGASHVISSTGKRHNSGCRYFGSGRACGATDGIACKICGG